MAIERAKFPDGQTIQVLGMDTTNAETVAANVATTAVTADKIVEVQDVGGTGAWFLIGEEPLTPAVDTGVFIPAYGTTRPFILKAGLQIEATAKINVRTLDVEGA
jgi:hypothetical protein